jgi:hypothetical protein
MLYFDFVVELSARQQFEDYVQRVFGFEDFKQSHTIAVADAAHYFDLFDKALLSVFLAVRCLLRECLHSVVHSVLQFLRQIDGGEVAFANFLDWFELLVKASLIEFAFENLSPTLQIRLVCQTVHTRFLPPFEADLKFVFHERKFEIEVKLNGSISNIREANLNQ